MKSKSYFWLHCFLVALILVLGMVLVPMPHPKSTKVTLNKNESSGNVSPNVSRTAPHPIPGHQKIQKEQQMAERYTIGREIIRETIFIVPLPRRKLIFKYLPRKQQNSCKKTRRN